MTHSGGKPHNVGDKGQRYKTVEVQMFKAGDRVRHIGRAECGTVLESNTTGIVRVEFDNRTRLGNKSIGEFDEVWFKTHPGWLMSIDLPPDFR